MLSVVYLYECDECGDYEESDTEQLPEGWIDDEDVSLHYCQACAEAANSEGDADDC